MSELLVWVLLKREAGLAVTALSVLCRGCDLGDPSSTLQYLLECLWSYFLPMLVVYQGAFYVLMDHLRLKDKTGMFH